MKLLLLLSIATGALALGGCAGQVAGVAIASGEQASGDIYANSKLAKVDPSPAGTAAQKQAVSDLGRVGTDLQSFAAGTLSAFELGAVEAQLKSDGVALSSNTQAIDDINSILNIFAKSVTASGLVTPQQALAQGVITNIVSGFATSIQDYEGQWSVSNPGAWTAPSK